MHYPVSNTLGPSEDAFTLPLFKHDSNTVTRGLNDVKEGRKELNASEIACDSRNAAVMLSDLKLTPHVTCVSGDGEERKRAWVSGYVRIVTRSIPGGRF